MLDRSAADALMEFAQRYGNIRLQSTSATVVTYAGTLYNVDGSTYDPKIGGVTWKQLLVNSGINGNCYVTAPLPTVASSHPGFDVGGHMTTNSHGKVVTGQSCYLMPLCSWHNSTSRNHQAFSHTQTRMLELSGYMQAEPAATFLARMPTDAAYTLVGADGPQLFTADLAEPHVDALWGDSRDAVEGGTFPEYYLLFRQIREDGVISYVIDSSRLPEATTG
ncbi:hypothetical protein [Rhizobium sp. SAFR-030]|uniref:hypothetical protein n=1 Tax=Rhizobium sp. SAFR-030 TaxID=3387277 RepID=UPI003F805821